MKTLATICAATLAFAAIAAPAFAQAQKPAASAAPAAGQKVDAPVIAVVDVNEVLQRSKAGQALQPQFEKLKKGYEDQLNRERDALTKEAQQLEGQRAVLAPEAFAQRMNALRQKDQDLGREVAERKRTLDATLANNLGQIRNALFQASADIAHERGINIILPKEAVVIIARNLEITDEVLHRVDAKLPSMTLKVAPSPAAQQQPSPRPQKK